MAGTFSLDNEKIKIPCPKCRTNLEVTIGQAKRSPEVKCRSCATPIKLDASKLKKDLDGIEKSMRDFQRSLGNMFKK